MKSKIGKIISAAAVCLLFISPTFAQTFCTEPGSIKQVKTRSAGNFEYVIFEIFKDPAGNYEPAYEVETAAPPFTGYSDEDGEIPVSGAEFKKITFRSFNWLCETKMKAGPPKKAVKDVKMLWSFEAIAEFAVGYGAGSKYITTYRYDAGALTKVVMKFRK
jgi:hypothetical protein